MGLVNPSKHRSHEAVVAAMRLGHFFRVGNTEASLGNALPNSEPELDLQFADYLR